MPNWFLPYLSRSRPVFQRATKHRVQRPSETSLFLSPGVVQNLATSSRPSDNARPHAEAAHPKIQRDPRFSELTPEHLDFFRAALVDSSGVINNLTEDTSDDVEPFNCDWMKKYRGHTKIVLKPKNTKEVSKVLKYCNDNMLAVVPQGGNSSLVGGSVPVFDEVVINLSRMNKIRSFDDTSGILVTDAGVIMENADTFLKEHNHVYPLDLGAKGSAQIGGNVATNAGGIRYLKYGSLHGSVLGVEVVLPNGTIVDDLGRLRKNNTGYDLKQLFIGAEGTIGIITGVSIGCPQQPSALNVAYLGLDSYENVQKAFKEAKLRLGEILSAFELMDAESQILVHKHSGNKPPLEGKYPFYCLVETSGSNGQHDNEKLETFLEHVMSEQIVADGVVAQDNTQLTELWGWREGISEATGQEGATYKYDLSIPIQNLYQVVDDARERLVSMDLIGTQKPVLNVVGFGHMGDSNLHLNIVAECYDRRIEAALEPWVYEWIQENRGSISAEHGLGLAKKNYIGYSRNEVMIQLMKQIKRLYDPKGIMMPYKYL